jgi:hypothetical protein
MGDLYWYWILGKYVFETILCQILTFTQWYSLNVCTHIISIFTKSQGSCYIVRNVSLVAQLNPKLD